MVEGEEGKFAYILWTRQASADTMQTSTAGKVRRAHSGRLEIGTDILLVNGTEVVKDDVQIKDFDCFKAGVVVFWTFENNPTGLLKVEFAKGRQPRISSSQSIRGCH